MPRGRATFGSRWNKQSENGRDRPDNLDLVDGSSDGPAL